MARTYPSPVLPKYPPPGGFSTAFDFQKQDEKEEKFKKSL